MSRSTKAPSGWPAQYMFKVAIGRCKAGGRAAAARIWGSARRALPARLSAGRLCARFGASVGTRARMGGAAFRLWHPQISGQASVAAGSARCTGTSLQCLGDCDNQQACRVAIESGTCR